MTRALISYVDDDIAPSGLGAGDSFGAFSEQPFYQEMNRSLVEGLAVELPPRSVVLELAAGTGGVTRLLAELVGGPKQARLLALEPSRSAVEMAMRRLEETGSASGPVEFLLAPANSLVRAVKATVGGGRVDAVVFCNAIHLLNGEEKAAVLRDVRSLLQPQGLLAVNTTFFQGAVPESTQSFYRAWILGSVRDIRARGLTLNKDKVQARQQLTPQDLEALLGEAGFGLTRVWMDQAEFTAEGLEAISEYEPFSAGALPGVPLQAAIAALKKNVPTALAASGHRTITRTWLQVIAAAQ